MFFHLYYAVFFNINSCFALCSLLATYFKEAPICVSHSFPTQAVGQNLFVQVVQTSFNFLQNKNPNAQTPGFLSLCKEYPRWDRSLSRKAPRFAVLLAGDLPAARFSLG